jgi:hypothetical protein
VSNGNGNGSGGNGGGPRRNPRNHARRPGDAAAADFWKAAPNPGRPAEVTPATDPAALLRSLGRPPLDQAGADRYLAAVAERAAGLATALAAVAGILTIDDEG